MKKENNIDCLLNNDRWTDLSHDDTMSMKEITELYEYMTKKEALKQFCDTSKIKYREETKQYYIYVDRKQYTANSQRALINKLYEAYSKKAYTLDKAYRDWMLWRREIGTAPKTLQENANEWKHFIQDSAIASMVILTIDNRDLEDFYYSITKDFAIDSKRLTNITSVLNGIFRRCLSLRLIPHNPMVDVDMSVFRKRCKPKNTSKDNYTLAERSAILKYLAPKDDVYSLAISLSLYLCVRIGELLAIRPEDISNNALHINRAMRLVQYMNDDLTFSREIVTNEERVKGNKDTGFRAIPLTEKAMAIINKTMTLYPNQEFLFMHKGKQLRGDAFNRELKKVCTALGIKYRSSHQIRFTVATMLYENNVPITQLSLLLGHSDTNTTWHYIRQSKPDQTTLETMKAALD